jgi:hypothetical protein
MTKSKKKSNDDGFIERVLMSLIMDLESLSEVVERTRIQVFVLAKERGIEVPAA